MCFESVKLMSFIMKHARL